LWESQKEEVVDPEDILKPKGKIEGLRDVLRAALQWWWETRNKG